MIKLKLIFFISGFVILTGCSIKTKTEPAHVDISLYESYNLTDIYPAFLNANKVIRKLELDSLSKIKTGVALLDQINADKVKTDPIHEQGIDNYPLFKVFTPNITLQGELKSSAMLGTTKDSVMLLNYISKTDTCFNNHINWRITGSLYGDAKSLYAIKKDKEKISIELSDIDSVLVLPIGLNSFGGVVKKISDLKGMSEYWIEFKVKNNFKNKLGSNTYTLIMKMNSKEFSGSVSRSEEYTLIGMMDNKDFEILKSIFEKIMKIKTAVNLRS